MTDRINDLFLIGCGFTKAVFPKRAPLNKDLVQVLIAAQADSALALYRQAYRSDDIEILLTHLDLEINGLADGSCSAARRRLEADREAIDSGLARYFEQFRFAKSQDTITPETRAWLDIFAKSVLNRHDVVVALNYDCFLEGLLDSHGLWSPSTGYGPICTPVPGSSVAKAPNPKCIMFYKIHGSENFYSAPQDLDRTQEVWAIVNAEIFPLSGASSILGVHDGNPRIIAPSFVKQFPRQMQQMTIMAIESAQMATNMVIIGCGLRPEDSHLWFLLTSFIRDPAEGKRIIIVDLNGEAIREKIYRQYGPDLPVETLGQGRGLDECAVKELASRLHPRGT
jgi:hypothetical protein